MKAFIHGVARIFESDEAREKRELAELEQRRQARLERQHIVQRAATFRDRVTEAERQFVRSVAPIDAAVGFDREKIYFLWLNRNGGEPAGMQVEVLARMLAEHEAIKLHAEELKAYLFRQIVGLAQKALAEYEAQNSEALRGIELSPADEPPFEHQILPVDFYTSGASAAAVRAALTK
jgi:hypothetical protein